MTDGILNPCFLRHLLLDLWKRAQSTVRLLSFVRPLRAWRSWRETFFPHAEDAKDAKAEAPERCGRAGRHGDFVGVCRIFLRLCEHDVAEQNRCRQRRATPGSPGSRE